MKLPDFLQVGRRIIVHSDEYGQQETEMETSLIERADILFSWVGGPIVLVPRKDNKNYIMLDENEYGKTWKAYEVV